jgi:hypothetical protein
MVVKLHIEGISKFEDQAQAAFYGAQLIKSSIHQEASLFAKDLESKSKRDYLSGRPGLNVQSGRLRSSIRGLVKDVGESNLEISFGTDVPYAKYHEQPDGPGSGRIPRRAFLEPAMADLYPTFQKTVEGILEKWATKGISGGQ